jgi:hypothetical protein
VHLRLARQRVDHRSPKAAAAEVGIDDERDRPGGDIDRVGDDRPVRTLAAVDRAAIERAAIDIAEVTALRPCEVAVGAGLDRAAELLAHDAVRPVEHGRQPLRPAKPPPGLRIAKPRLDDRQIRARERAQDHLRLVHADMIACRLSDAGEPGGVGEPCDLGAVGE